MDEQRRLVLDQFTRPAVPFPEAVAALRAAGHLVEGAQP